MNLSDIEEVVNRHFCPASSLPTTTLSGFPSSHFFVSLSSLLWSYCILFSFQDDDFSRQCTTPPRTSSPMGSEDKSMVRFYVKSLKPS